MLKIKEYDVEDKEVYYIQEFYSDEFNHLQQGIMYLANANYMEINVIRAKVPQVLNILYKKCYLNKNHEMIKVEWLLERID